MKKLLFTAILTLSASVHANSNYHQVVSIDEVRYGKDLVIFTVFPKINNVGCRSKNLFAVEKRFTSDINGLLSAKSDGSLVRFQKSGCVGKHYNAVRGFIIHSTP